jgi:peptidyl-prolyl cis-trans isomerase-like 1
MGNIVVELYWNEAPRTCRNFAELARRGYYNDSKFHRVVKDFIVQGGDPTGTGRGGSSIYGNYFNDEISSALKHTGACVVARRLVDRCVWFVVGAGIVSMANAGPNTNGSQFFFTLAPAQSLDKLHTIFGRIHSGIHVLHKFSLIQTTDHDRPVDDITLIRAYVTPNV